MMDIDASTQDPADQVADWVDAEAQAAHDEAFAKGEPWYAQARKRKARLIAQEGRARASERREQVSNALPALAARRVITLWVAQAEQLSTRNPFHPDLEPAWRSRITALQELAQTRPIFSPRHCRSTTASEIPGYLKIVTPRFVSDVLAAEMVRRSQVAADPVLLAATTGRFGELTVVVVQHQRSGLRAKFTIRGVDPPFGAVLSKPYAIESIDPVTPGTCGWWRSYAGLGIGTRIYRRAHEMYPTVRWTAVALSDYSVAVRRKVHADEPYNWASAGCDWCARHGIRWDTAQAPDFAGHPESNK